MSEKKHIVPRNVRALNLVHVITVLVSNLFLLLLDNICQYIIKTKQIIKIH